MELRSMPGAIDYKLPRCGLLPMKESGFLSPSQVNMLVDPGNLNSGRLQDIYAEIGSQDFPDPDVHEIFYKNLEHGGVEREVVFVDSLHCYGPRILVSLEAARAMHQGIAIMSRKVDSLFCKLRTCREDYFKELLYLREQVAKKTVGARHVADTTDAVDGMAMWFHPPNYQDTLSIELLESRVSEVQDQWRDLCQEKQDEVNILRAKLSLTESKGDGADPKKMLAKMAKVIPLEHLLVIVRNASTNHEAFYTAAERVIAQRKVLDDKEKPKRSKEKEKVDVAGEAAKTKSDNTEKNDTPSMIDAFLQSDFNRFKKEHDRVMESMNKARKREEDLVNKHEEAITQLKKNLEAEKARVTTLQEQCEESCKKVKDVESKLETEKALWKTPAGKANRSATQKRKSAKKRMTMLASRMDELEDDSLRALARLLQPITRLSIAEELIMTMTADQRASVATTLRCCNAGGLSEDLSVSNFDSSRENDVLTHTETSRSSSPTHRESRALHDRKSPRPLSLSSRASRRTNRGAAHSASAKSPSPRTPIDIGSNNSTRNNSPVSSPKTQHTVSRSGSLASFAKSSSRAASFEPMLEDLDEDDDDCPHISERTWQHLLESCSDHRNYPGVRRRESLLSQPRSEEGFVTDSRRTSNFSTVRNSTSDSQRGGFGAEARRSPASNCASRHSPAPSNRTRPSADFAFDASASDVVRTPKGGRGRGPGQARNGRDEQEPPSDATLARSSASSTSRFGPQPNSETLADVSVGVGRHSPRKTRRCNTTRGGMSPRKRLYSDCGAQTDDVGHDAVIRQLRADLVCANEYMPSSAHQKVIKRIVERVRVVKETRKVFVDLRSLHECVPTPFFSTLSSVKARLWSNGTQTDATWDDPLTATSAVGLGKSIAVKSPATTRIAALTPRAAPGVKSSDAAEVGFQNSLTRILHRLSTQAEFVQDKSDATPKEGSSSDDNCDEQQRQFVPPPSPTAFLAPGSRGGGTLLAPSPMPGPGGPPPSPMCLSPVPSASLSAAPFLESLPSGTTAAPAAPDTLSLTMREAAWHPKRPLLAAANMPANMPPQPPPPSPQPLSMPALDDSTTHQQVASEVPATAMSRRPTRSWEPSLPDTKEETAAALSAQEAGAQVGAGDNTMTALRRKSSLLRTSATTSKLEIPARRPSKSTRRSFTETHDALSLFTSNAISSGSVCGGPPHCAVDEELAQVPEHSLAESPVDTNSSSYNDDRKTSASTSAWTSLQTSRVGSPRSLYTSRHTSAFTSRRTSMSDSNFASRRVSVLVDDLAFADQQQRLKDAQRPSVVLTIPPVFDAPDTPEGGAVFDVIMGDVDVQTDLSVQGIKKALFDDQDDEGADHNTNSTVREDASPEVEFAVDKQSSAETFRELQHLCMNFLYADQVFLAQFFESIGYTFQSAKGCLDGEGKSSDDDAISTASSVDTENRAFRVMARHGMNALQISKALLSNSNPLLRRRRVIGLATVSPDKRHSSDAQVKRTTVVDVATRRVMDSDVGCRRSTLDADGPDVSVGNSAFPPLPLIGESRTTVVSCGAGTVWGFQPITARGSLPRRSSQKSPQKFPKSSSPRKSKKKDAFAALKRAVLKVRTQKKSTLQDGEEADHEEWARERKTLTEYEDDDGHAICASAEAARQALSDAVAVNTPTSPSARPAADKENEASMSPASPDARARAPRATVRHPGDSEIRTASLGEAGASHKRLTFSRAKCDSSSLDAPASVAMKQTSSHCFRDTPRDGCIREDRPSTSAARSFVRNPHLRSSLRKHRPALDARGRPLNYMHTRNRGQGLRLRAAEGPAPGVDAMEALVKCINVPKQ